MCYQGQTEIGGKVRKARLLCSALLCLLCCVVDEFGKSHVLTTSLLVKIDFSCTLFLNILVEYYTFNQHMSS